METFRWNTSFETGLETVDEQHRGLLTLVNRFGALVAQGTGIDSAELDQVYGELARYSAYHFGEERRLAEQVGVDGRHMELHRRAHASFLADVTAIRHEAGEQLAEAARPLLRFLVSWLVCHILGMDQAMARQVHAIRRGVRPADAYDAERADQDVGQAPLLEALNTLFDVVSERNRQLLEVNRSLERKVAERTRELEEANRDLAGANERLETLAMTDQLTGLFNRRHAMDRLASEVSTARRHREPLSLVVIDADGLKAVNDTHGHDAGDAVIRSLGSSLRQLFRAGDVVCRMGGDEFLVICPRTPGEAAFLVAERVRSIVASMRVPTGSGEWKGSLSAGVACLGPGAEEVEPLLKAADLAVYEAKRRGRNRVELYGS